MVSSEHAPILKHLRGRSLATVFVDQQSMKSIPHVTENTIASLYRINQELALQGSPPLLSPDRSSGKYFAIANKESSAMTNTQQTSCRYCGGSR